MKTISVFGSTGVVGRRALEVIEHLKEEFCVKALIANQNTLLLEEQIKRYHPSFVVVFDERKAKELQKKTEIEVLVGHDGLIHAAIDADISLFAMSGIQGIQAALSAAQHKKTLLIASKEMIVVAGDLLKGANILPLDSEHASLFQCIQNEEGIDRVYLMASGGPFLHKKLEELETVTVEETLLHPKWSMGKKSAVDSSTLMNKGLEMIEAKYLFNLSPHKISALIHPEAVIQSIVSFKDGYIRAQGASCDMSHSIQWALQYPKRTEGIGKKIAFDEPFKWTFEAPDQKKFRCLSLAEAAMKMGGSYPCFLTFANEILVNRFLQGEIKWIEIGEKLDQLISSHKSHPVLDLSAILNLEIESKTTCMRI